MAGESASTRYSLSSCREMLTVCIGFHHSAGLGSSFEILQGERALLELISSFLLQPPHHIDDIFVSHLTGSGVELLEDRRFARRGTWNSSTFRSDLSCAGLRKVYSGLVRWKVCCTGQSFAIGVVACNRISDFKKDKSMDWPFVRDGFGSGFGLIKSDGKLVVAQELYSASQWSYGSTYGQCSYDDSRVPVNSDTTNFAVVLDMDRARVSFEADDASIPGASIEGIDTDNPYRFITSLPDRDSAAVIVQ
mmetsp:Transcript_100591/g.194258  ORF Transcript_100591/g.194258 Transcript_100591/m.194258 type:complete len:249 (-) Transcript_100591:231-977(-)